MGVSFSGVRGDGGCGAFGRGRQAKAQVNCCLKSFLQGLVIDANSGLEGANEVTDNIFGAVVQQGHQPGLPRQAGRQFAHQPLHQHGFGALPDPELHAMALTEHLGGAADAL